MYMFKWWCTNVHDLSDDEETEIVQSSDKAKKVGKLQQRIILMLKGYPS